MSNLLGPVTCPRCRGDEFRLEDWETYTSVLCRTCGAKAGELVPDRRGSNVSSTLDPAAHPLLGRQVAVTLDRGPRPVIARGQLLSYSTMGECVLLEDGGDIIRCWPMLEIRAAGSFSNVSSTPLPPPPPEMDPLMSCPCGRGDYALCRNCPYPFCSVHGTEAEGG